MGERRSRAPSIGVRRTGRRLSHASGAGMVKLRSGETACVSEVSGVVPTSSSSAPSSEAKRRYSTAFGTLLQRIGTSDGTLLFGAGAMSVGVSFAQRDVVLSTLKKARAERSGGQPS